MSDQTPNLQGAQQEVAFRPLTRFRALLVCRDAASRKWGPRWLEQAGFKTSVVDAAEAIEVANAMKPELVIVESSMRGRKGRPLYLELRRCGTPAPATVIVLATNSRDVQVAADDQQVSAVMRKPFDWKLISQRASQLAAWHEKDTELCQVRAELETARTDVSELRRNLERSAEHDELTQLPTRSKFRRLHDQALYTPGPAAAEVSVLVIRLNRFRIVNETLGHDNGSSVLVEVANRLSNCLRLSASTGTGFVTAVLARLGGISFGVAVTGENDAEQVRMLSAVILKAISQPVQIAGRTIYLNASIGAALSPGDGQDIDALLQHAESAAQEARQRGGGFRMFREPLVAGSARQLYLDGMLHEALEAKQFHIEYQPMLDVAESRVVGAEALLRWHHPVEGLISPAEFIPVAESNGLISRIGEFVIDRACRQLSEWNQNGVGRLRMAINLSLYQLRHDNVVEVVARALRAWRLEPSQIELELSERGVVGRDAEVLRQLHLLKSLGIRLSIDDFGTGDASIAYLKELPIDALKIDRSYIHGALSDSRDCTIAAGMAALARRLGLTVIAEGVEVPAQLELLREWGCHQYQGFYFSPSVPAGRFLPLAKSANQRIAAMQGNVPGLV